MAGNRRRKRTLSFGSQRPRPQQEPQQLAQTMARITPGELHPGTSPNTVQRRELTFHCVRKVETHLVPAVAQDRLATAGTESNSSAHYVGAYSGERNENDSNWLAQCGRLITHPGFCDLNDDFCAGTGHSRPNLREAAKHRSGDFTCFFGHAAFCGVSIQELGPSSRRGYSGRALNASSVCRAAACIPERLYDSPHDWVGAKSQRKNWRLAKDRSRNCARVQSSGKKCSAGIQYHAQNSGNCFG